MPLIQVTIRSPVVHGTPKECRSTGGLTSVPHELLSRSCRRMKHRVAFGEQCDLRAAQQTFRPFCAGSRVGPSVAGQGNYTAALAATGEGLETQEQMGDHEQSRYRGGRTDCPYPLHRLLRFCLAFLGRLEKCRVADVPSGCSQDGLHHDAPRDGVPSRRHVTPAVNPAVRALLLSALRDCILPMELEGSSLFGVG